MLHALCSDQLKWHTHKLFISWCQPANQTNKTCIGKGADASQINIPLYIFTQAGHSFFCWDLWCTHFAWNSNTACRMRSPIGFNKLPCIARTLFQPCMPTTFCWQDQMSQTKHQYDVSKCCNLIGRNINTHRNIETYKLDACKLRVGRLWAGFFLVLESTSLTHYCLVWPRLS